MVSYKQIQASNTLINESTAPQVAVFVGGTSGIGKLTIKALVSTNTNVKIYLIGRKSSEESTLVFIEELRNINSKAEVIWIEGEVSLLSETKRICEDIKRKEPRIDLLFLSTGYAPFGPRIETSEGIEIAQSLEYYTRILFIQHLLPPLNNSESPRVVSVLGGGMERTSIDLDDLDLKKSGNFGSMKAQGQYMTMTTTTLDKLASENPDVTFIHSWPGWVNTGNVRRGNPGWFMKWVIDFILEPLISLFSFSDQEAGGRHLFLCTSAAFGGHGVHWEGKFSANIKGKGGGGLFLVGWRCECTTNAKVMRVLREKAQTRIWEHTGEVLRPYL